MKARIYLAAFILLAGMTIIYCSDNSNKSTDPIEPPQFNATELSLLESSNSFAFDIFKEMVAQEEDTNIFISPLSMSYALTMTYNGADGQTEEAMKTVLGLGDYSSEEINQSFKSLTATLLTLDPSLIVELANSIWYLNTFEVEQDFIDVNRDYFDAQVIPSDFSSPTACDDINGWIEDKTNDKIQDIIDCPIDPMTVMFLINAIYFKGSWTVEFDPEETSPGTFYSPGGEVQCDMMNRWDEISYLFTDEFKAVDLPYGDELFSMTVFLPAEDVSVDQFIDGLTEEKFYSWLADFKQDSVDLYMPKFRFNYDKKLKEVLSDMGMAIAFQGNADFSGINPTANLYINDVIHGSFVQVDEKGTEAAAVTIVEIRYTSVPRNYMRVDSPFVFVIHEKTTGAILFMGKVINPIWQDA